MASTYLTRTLGTSTNVYKGTVSHWIKRSGLGSMGTFAAWNNGVSDTNRAYLNLYNDTIYFYDEANSVVIQTNRLFRDTSAWYHIVVAWDTSQGTVADRIKIYVNGVQETSFATANYPSVNSTLQFNTSGRTFGLGSYANSGAAAGFFDGSMANVEFVDGQQLTPAYFGSTDSTTGIWTPQASSTISSYGTNGFKLKMDTATPGADTSGNTNNFTVGGGTPTLTQGSPSNVYAVFNSLSKNDAGTIVFSNGNLTVLHSGTDSRYASYSTIGASSGKWYMEIKIDASSQPDVVVGVGSNVEEINRLGTYYGTSTDPTSVGYFSGDGDKYINGNATAYGSAYGTGDIISIAMDLDNSKLYFRKNNDAWNNSGDPTSGSTGTGAIALTADLTYFMGGSHATTTTRTSAYSGNFGEGFFGTTAAGTQADDNGQGLFAYDVPTGYYALNTKNLEAYG